MIDKILCTANEIYMGYGDKCYQMAPWVTSNKKTKVLQGEKPSQEETMVIDGC